MTLPHCLSSLFIGPGSAALPSNIAYFGSAKDDEDVDEEEEEEEEEDSACSASASCQSTPRKSKGPSKCIANGHGTYTPQLHTLIVCLFVCL